MLSVFFILLRNITVGRFVNQLIKNSDLKLEKLARVVIFLVFAVIMYMHIDDITLYDECSCCIEFIKTRKKVRHRC